MLSVSLSGDINYFAENTNSPVRVVKVRKIIFFNFRAMSRALLLFQLLTLTRLFILEVTMERFVR
jgi:hypothetical protein